MPEDEEFKPLNTIICPACKAQNLSWAMGCWECGSSLFEESDPVDQQRQEIMA